ncbi:MAG: flagellar type III secretion system pore protein FliP [bacterium]
MRPIQTLVRRFAPQKTWLKCGLIVAIVMLASAVYSQNLALPRVQIGLESTKNPKDVAVTLQVLAMLTILSVAPAFLIMMTGFTRIIIVLSFLRSAIGAQSIPPNQILIGLSLFLTFFVMTPVFDQINNNAIQPYMANKITFQQATTNAEIPLRSFMLRQTYDRDLGLFLRLRNQPRPKTPDDLSLLTVVPAFVTSELKTAFIIGFYIYVPFLVIDLVIASVLMSMGMMMLPPVMISLPAKILVFILSNGWYVLIGAIAQGFR